MVGAARRRCRCREPVRKAGRNLWSRIAPGLRGLRRVARLEFRNQDHRTERRDHRQGKSDNAQPHLAQVSRYLDRIGAPSSSPKNALLLLAFSRSLRRLAVKSRRLEPAGGPVELSSRAVGHGWSRQVNARLDLENIVGRTFCGSRSCPTSSRLPQPQSRRAGSRDLRGLTLSSRPICRLVSSPGRNRPDRERRVTMLNFAGAQQQNPHNTGCLRCRIRQPLLRRAPMVLSLRLSRLYISPNRR